MQILDIIIHHKKEELIQAKLAKPLEALKQSSYYSRTCLSLSKFIKDEDKNGIIAEYKRKSPSEGIINDQYTIEEVVKAYQAHGASACSILTDHEFFGGKAEWITEIRPLLNIPILRKEFIIDEYQIHEAKAIGADAILLICECLSKEQISQFCRLAHDLGLEVLLELHSEDQLYKVDTDVDLIGVNNRNLSTFKVSLQFSRNLIEHLPKNCVKISESGIKKPSDITELRSIGYDGFLIGTQFMKSASPMESFASFSSQIPEKNKAKSKSLHELAIKVCGMMEASNIRELEALDIDYIGHIFYDKSPRFANALYLEEGRPKVGVFVDEMYHEIKARAVQENLSIIQLHGAESPIICEQLKEEGFKVWKVFGIDDDFDFNVVKPYLDKVDAFLFDTKTRQHGGSGRSFNWSKLYEYTETTPFFLSGGIGPSSIDDLRLFKHPHWIGIDINSQFETAPGIKDIELIKTFIEACKEA